MQKQLIIFIICGILFSAAQGDCTPPLKQHLTSNTSVDDVYSKEAAYHYSLAVLLRLNHELSQAIDQMKKALAIHPDSIYLNTELVSLYAEHHDFDNALSLGETMLAKNPGNVELRSILGGVYFNLRKYDKAVQEYQTIIEIDPKNLVARLFLATI